MLELGELATAQRQSSAFRFLMLLVLLFVACTSDGSDGANKTSRNETGDRLAALILPELAPIGADAGRVKIVATTGMIGDVVSEIAGDDADVNVLMAANQDPHGYQTTAGDLRQVVDADVVFVNGWRLEEGLLDDLANAAGDTPFVPVSAGIEGRIFEDGASADQAGEALRIDPHVWLAPPNVSHWVDNIEASLIALDPGNADGYRRRAASYRERLSDLDTYYRDLLATLPPNRRVMVTNHDAFGYFANEYGFEVIGTVLPGDSTLAEPASRDLASLVQSMQEASICSIFVERSASQQLATQLANDLDHCDEVQVALLYSGALGEAGSGAESYLEMMRMNVDVIAGALMPEKSSPND